MSPQSWLACCVVRRDGSAEECGAMIPAQGPEGAVKKPFFNLKWASKEPDEVDEADFHDCVETEFELAALCQVSAEGTLKTQQQPLAKGARPLLPLLHGAQPALVPRPEEVTPIAGRASCCGAVNSCAVAAASIGADCASELVGELGIAAEVLEKTREEWSDRVLSIRKGAVNELQHVKMEWADLASWADLTQAQRMLKANLGDFKKAVDMFLQALELRARNSDLYDKLQCEVCCDMRIIGLDKMNHSVIYTCFRSQTLPLRHLINQFIVTFEAGCKLAQSYEKSEGRIFLIADMHGFESRLLMDMAAVKELAASLSSVFAERMFKIVIVDFSRAAQVLWLLVKRLLTPVTRNKLAFISKSTALRQLTNDLEGEAYDSLKKSFEINRDPSSTESERALFARRTTIHDVPLGPPIRG